jgi:hydrogenase nickel incorporation protein HypB
MNPHSNPRTNLFVQPFDRLVDPLDRLLDRLVGPGSPGADAPTARLHLFGHDHDHGDAASDDESDILAAYRRQAEALHERVVHEHGIFTVEFLGSTGSGKTSLLEYLVDQAPDDERIGVIVGDVAGDDDAARLRERGVQVANVNTGKECHLDPALVESALEEFDLSALDTLYLENVGNMVCPADFPLGAQARIIVVSTTEGDDVVRKHPLLFQACDATVVNKVDIADAVDADVGRMRADVGDVGGDEMPVFETSAKSGKGLEALSAYVDGVRTEGHAHGHGDGHAHGESEHTHDQPDDAREGEPPRANGGDAGQDDTEPADDHVHAHPHDENGDHSHDHDHTHRHDHAHEHVDDDEAYVHSHEHEHLHSHDHTHGHDHAAHDADHDHRHVHDHQHDHPDDPEHEPGSAGVPRHDHAHEEASADEVSGDEASADDEDDS